MGAFFATSTVVMFVLMYLNTYAWPHGLFSETRTYMAILMGATMAVIILAQEREIAEMLYLIAELERSDDGTRPEIFKDTHDPEVVTVAQAIERTVIGTLDPQPMTEAEAEAALPPGPSCGFTWTKASRPIFQASAPADGPVAGVMKLQGALVRLMAEAAKTYEALVDGAVLTTDGAAMRVVPLPEEDAEPIDGGTRRRADLVFALDRGLTVGYRGFYTCDAL